MIRQELLAASDAEIDEAIAFADPIVLRGLLYQLTGDEAIAAIPDTIAMMGIFGMVPTITDPEHIALLRGRAAELLKAYRDAGADDCPLGPESRLRRSMELACGGRFADGEYEMWREQLALDPMARGLTWPKVPGDAERDNFLVAVIGAGLGGFNAAIHLKAAGIPFVVIEKNSSVGGTWHENRYPGARLDTLSRIYFHIFGIDYQCKSPFSPAPDNEAYFHWMADRFSLAEDVQFDTEVKSVIWDEDSKLWEISAIGPDGPMSWRANAVISAVGFLNRPNLPDFPGMDSFEGPIVHTSRWPDDLDVTGKRVAVIGSGATGYQTTPVLAKMAEHLTFFQRTPSWCFEVPGYLAPYPAQVNWLDRNFPYLINFIRFQQSWMLKPDSSMALVTIDPEHDDPHTVSPTNKAVREGCLDFIRRSFADRPDLLEKMIPVAPPMTSRPVLVDAVDNIYAALRRDNVDLVTEAIAAINPNGLVTADGAEHRADVIVCATGFKANEFLWPMEVRGRDGRDLGSLWAKDGARAYIGTMLPGFPNFFMIYGPNMNPFSNGLGLVDSEEIVTRFALQCIAALILGEGNSVDVKQAAFDRYNAEVDRVEKTKVYSDKRVTSYYQNKHGRSAVNCPFDYRLLWNWLRDPAGANDEGEADPVVRPWLGADLVVE
jgi:4-hydroxyacetophenone monooxygenase